MIQSHDCIDERQNQKGVGKALGKNEEQIRLSSKMIKVIVKLHRSPSLTRVTAQPVSSGAKGGDGDSLPPPAGKESDDFEHVSSSPHDYRSMLNHIRSTLL